MQGPDNRRRVSERRRGVAVSVLLAIAFLLLVPDPHDHGDANSLGGLFRFLFPGSVPISGPQQAGTTPRPEPRGFCPIHFWQQVAATALLLALLPLFFLSSESRAALYLLAPSTTDSRSFHNRAPPILS